MLRAATACENADVTVSFLNTCPFQLILTTSGRCFYCTLEIYTISIPQAQRKAVENLAQLVTNGDELGQAGKKLPLASERIQ